jgi:hypothetical protein
MDPVLAIDGMPIQLSKAPPRRFVEFPNPPTFSDCNELTIMPWNEKKRARANSFLKGLYRFLP